MSHNKREAKQFNNSQLFSHLILFCESSDRLKISAYSFPVYEDANKLICGNYVLKFIHIDLVFQDH